MTLTSRRLPEATTRLEGRPEFSASFKEQSEQSKQPEQSEQPEFCPSAWP